VLSRKLGRFAVYKALKPHRNESGYSTLSKQRMPAEALIDFLAAPAAAPVYKANGMEPEESAKTFGPREAPELAPSPSSRAFR
jgi:hypothetical protein